MSPDDSPAVVTQLPLPLPSKPSSGPWGGRAGTVPSSPGARGLPGCRYGDPAGASGGGNLNFRESPVNVTLENVFPNSPWPWRGSQLRVRGPLDFAGQRGRWSRSERGGDRAGPQLLTLQMPSLCSPCHCEPRVFVKLLGPCPGCPTGLSPPSCLLAPAQHPSV